MPGANVLAAFNSCGRRLPTVDHQQFDGFTDSTVHSDNKRPFLLPDVPLYGAAGAGSNGLPCVQGPKGGPENAKILLDSQIRESRSGNSAGFKLSLAD